MMQIIKYPEQSTWAEILKRPTNNYNALREQVVDILLDIKKNGDKALKYYAEKFDDVTLSDLAVSAKEWERANTVTSELKQAIGNAIQNIRLFHTAQVEQVVKIETKPGVECWRKSVAIEKVGLYIPGGTAPLFSTLLMLAIPAMLAGCKDIIICTPPDKNGNIPAAILFVAKELGLTQLYKVGGAQAIAAMAYGTDTIPQVYKIFGPGNNYVTCAKMLVSAEGTAIDMPAGPSEVAILADGSAAPAYIAADLLSQAEHGMDSQVLLVCNSRETINDVIACLEIQIDALPRKSIAQKALANSKAILVNNLDEGMQILNEYAPEHLIISCENAETIAEQVINAGSVFLGKYSPESAGDYASGTNHTLPTNGFAKTYSGVSLDSFVKKITFQKLSKSGLELIGDTVKEMALAEGLYAHANAITIRTNKAYETI